MSEDERVPVAQVLPGMDIHPLEPRWTPMEAFVLIKCMDDEGDTSWAYRTTNRLNLEELLGACEVHVALLKKELLEAWDEDDDS